MALLCRHPGVACIFPWIRVDRRRPRCGVCVGEIVDVCVICRSRIAEILPHLVTRCFHDVSHKSLLVLPEHESVSPVCLAKFAGPFCPENASSRLRLRRHYVFGGPFCQAEHQTCFVGSNTATNSESKRGCFVKLTSGAEGGSLLSELHRQAPRRWGPAALPEF